jgi:selenocysteine lyase/cysteine desulfurase
VTASAFPSQVLAWHPRCRDDGARLVVARPAPGESETDAVLRMLDADPAIRVLSLAHVSWVDGSVLDLDTIAAHARARGVALVLDLSQSLGALPARIAAWQPAFAVSVGYKWLLGPGGLAYLWVAPAWRDRGEPIEQHWRARDPAAVWREDPAAEPPYRAGARRYDAGEVPSPLRLAMAGTALRQIHAWRIERIAVALQSRVRTLARALHDEGLDTWLPGPVASHILGLRPPQAQWLAIGAALRQAGVITTLRRGCVRLAPHLHVGVEQLPPVAQLLARVR